MTVIVAIGGVPDLGVVMGADSEIGTPYGRVTDTLPKLCRVGPLLVGLAGRARIGDVLRYADTGTLGEQLETDGEPHRLLVTAFVPWLRALVEAAGMLDRSEGDDVLHGNTDLLIGWRSTIFYVGTDFSVVQARDNYGAIGSGAEVALGVLYGMRRAMGSVDMRRAAEKTAQVAMEGAAHLVRGVSGPFDILTEHPARGERRA